MAIVWWSKDQLQLQLQISIWPAKKPNNAVATDVTWNGRIEMVMWPIGLTPTSMRFQEC